MGKKVDGKEIFEGDIFAEQKANAKEFEKLLRTLSKSFTELGKTALASMPKEIVNSADIKKAAEGFQKIKTATEGFNKVTEERRKLQERLKILGSDRIQQNEELKVQITEQRKINKTLAKETLGLVGAFEKENKRLKELQTRYKNLAVSGRQNTKEARKLRKEILSLDASLKKINAAARNASTAFKGLGLSFGNVLGAIGVTGGAIGITRAFRGAFDVIKDFETGLIGVSKTTNLSADELKKFGDEVINLTDNRLSAIDPRKLLEIAEIAGQLGVTGSANLLKFSETITRLEASTDLIGEEGAKSLARILNVTGESASTIDRLGASIVELGNSFAASEGEIVKVATEVSRSTAIFGVSSTEALALGAVLKSLGVQAEGGGTAIGKAFRTINNAVVEGGGELEKFAKITGLTGKELQKVFRKDATKAFDLFVKGLNRTVSEGEDLSATLASVGLNTDRIAKVLPPLVGRYDELNRALQLSSEAYDANNALTEESDKRFNSIEGSLQAVSNSLTNYIRQFTQANDASSKINMSLRFIAENLKSIIKFVGIAVTGFIAFKVAIAATRIGIFLYKFATDAATRSTLLFNKAVKSNQLLALLGLLTAAVSLLFDYGTAAKEAAKEQSNLNDELERQKELLGGITLQELEALINLNKEATLTTSQLRSALGLVNIEIENLGTVLVDANVKIAKSFQFRAKETREEFQSRLAFFLRTKDITTEEFNDIVQLANRRFDAFQLQQEINKREAAAAIVRKKTDKERLTRLREVNDELAENLKLREAITTGLASGDERDLIRLKLRREELEAEKRLLIDIRDLTEDKLEAIKLEGVLEDQVAKNLQKFQDAEIKRLSDIADKRAKDLADQIKAEEERRKALILSANLIADAFVEAQARQTQKQIEAINKELEASRNRVTELKNLATRESLNKDQSIAVEQKRQASLLLEQERRQRQQQLIELGLTAFKTYGAKVEQGDPNPLSSTIRDITLLTAFIGGLSSFVDGTIDTGTVRKPLDANGGRPAILHDNERIIDKEINKDFGGVSNKKSGQVMKAYNKGLLVPLSQGVQASAMAIPTYATWDSNAKVLAKFGKMEESLSKISKKPVYMGSDYDENRRYIAHTIKEDNTLTRTLKDARSNL